MKHKTLGAKRFLIFFLVLILSFGSVSFAYATTSLTSIAVDSIGAIAAAEISCHKDDIKQGIQDIFGGGDDDDEDTMSANSVPIAVVKDSKAAQQTAAASKAEANDTTCTKAVEQAAAQVILKQLTLATVNWINHGFKGGSSFFPKDTTSFLKAIGDQAAQKFIGNIGYDSKNYPFGKLVAQDIAKSVGNTFEKQAQFSLNAVMAQNYPNTQPPTAADFTNSFSQGGWAAFNSEFNTNNNPIGFTLAAQGEITARTQSASYNPAQDIKDQLARSGGFLDTTVCVAPSSYVDDGSSDKLAAAAQAKLKAGQWETEAEYQSIQQTIKDNTCTKQAKQTPGAVVASSLTTALNSPFNQLVNSKDLNADLTAIFNALANQLMQKGLSSLSSTAKTDDATYTNNGSYINPALDVEDGLGGQTSGSWSTENQNFNIFKDIPTIIPNETYTPTGPSDPKPEGYQQVMQKEVDAATHLIPLIYELDFCVPGPHPGWRSESNNNLQTFLSDTGELPSNSDSAISQGAKIFSKITDPLGMFASTGKSLTADKRNERMYGAIVSNKLSYHATLPTDAEVAVYGTLAEDPADPGMSGTPTAGIGISNNSKVNGHNPTANIFRTLFGRYADLVDKTYSPDTNIAIAERLALDYSIDGSEYPSIQKYQDAIMQNKTLMAGSIATVDQLQSLVTRIENLPSYVGYVDHSADYTPGQDKYYWYLQDFQKQNGVTDMSQLSPYQIELRRISSTFDLIAPKIHGTDDLNKEENALTAVNNKMSQFTGKGGYINQCVKDVADPSYTGPKARRAFPLSVIINIPTLTANSTRAAFDGRQDFVDFEGTLDTDISFLPDVHYAEGQAPDQIPHFEAVYGKETPDNTIQNDDVVTINSQPQKDAMAGLEELVGTY